MNDTNAKAIASTGWVKAQLPPRKERVERNPAVLAAVAALAVPPPEVKPISEHKTTVVLGVHRSPALASLLREARNREEIREIIDQANKGNPDKEVFEKRLQLIADEKASKKETVVVAEKSVPQDLFQLRFQKAFSDLKTAIVKAFSDADRKLAQEIKAEALSKEQKARLEKHFDKLIERIKEHRIVRNREENLLVDAGITQVLIIK
jgi:hypothetical protein